MTEQQEAQVREIYENLRKAHPDSGLAVTQEELKAIVKAVGLSQGHWYKCPKGMDTCMEGVCTLNDVRLVRLKNK